MTVLGMEIDLGDLIAGAALIGAFGNFIWTQHKTSGDWHPFIDITEVGRNDGFQKNHIRITARIRNARSNAHIRLDKIEIQKVFCRYLDLPAKNVARVYCIGKNWLDTVDIIYDVLQKPVKGCEPKNFIEPNSEDCPAYEIKFSDTQPLEAFKGIYALVFHFTRGDNKSGKIRKTFRIDDKAIC